MLVRVNFTDRPPTRVADSYRAPEERSLAENVSADAIRKMIASRPLRIPEMES